MIKNRPQKTLVFGSMTGHIADCTWCSVMLQTIALSSETIILGNNLYKTHSLLPYGLDPYGPYGLDPCGPNVLDPLVAKTV
jgi:hypothetical protein